MTRLRRTCTLVALQVALLVAQPWAPAAAAASEGTIAEALPAAGSPGTPLSSVLRYDAFIAGTRIGRAVVNLAVADGAYQITGTARTDGWLDAISSWRSRFVVVGRIDGVRREPLEFYYLERDDDSRREVRVRDGVLEVRKNGRARPRQPALPGLDLLSALFVLPGCDGDQVLNSGRSLYRLSVLPDTIGPADRPGASSSCRYLVIDEDDDRYEAELTFTRHQGLVVPLVIVLEGLFTARIELRDEDDGLR